MNEERAQNEHAEETTWAWRNRVPIQLLGILIGGLIGAGIGVKLSGTSQFPTGLAGLLGFLFGALLANIVTGIIVLDTRRSINKVQAYVVALATPLGAFAGSGMNYLGNSVSSWVYAGIGAIVAMVGAVLSTGTVIGILNFIERVRK
ncbi:MAG: hypothetical protein JST40_00520 [Armatimonadetes bacterium]|nr:hypothetical protein [Armatimonadota bacterium]